MSWSWWLAVAPAISFFGGYLVGRLLPRAAVVQQDDRRKCGHFGYHCRSLADPRCPGVLCASCCALYCAKRHEPASFDEAADAIAKAVEKAKKGARA